MKFIHFICFMKKSVLFLLIFCSFKTFSAVYLKVLYIAANRVNCVNDSTKKCYLVRDNPTDKWEIFNHTIEGFVYEEGTEYCILLEIQTPGVSEPAIPFDSTKIKYVLSEIKLKTVNQLVIKEKSNNLIPDNSRWILYKLKTKNEIKTFSIAKENLEFISTENKISGSTSCNTFSGTFSKDEKSIAFSNIEVTKNACRKHSNEPEFLFMLQNVNNYKVKKNVLYLFKGKTMLGMFTMKK